MAKTNVTKKLHRIKLSITTKLVAWLIITVLLGISMAFTRQLDNVLNGYEMNVLATSKMPSLEINFVDVGQGDCTLIKLPDGKSMIIDGGDKSGKEKVLKAIPEMFGNDFETFDYAVLTHTDSDHCGSLDDALNEYPAKVIYRPNVIATHASLIDENRNRTGTDEKYSGVDPAIAITKDNNSDKNTRFWWTYNDSKKTSETIEEENADTIISNLEKDKDKTSKKRGNKETAAYADFVNAAYFPKKIAKLKGVKPKVIISDGRRNDLPNNNKRPTDKSLVDIGGDVDNDGKNDYDITFFGPLSPIYTKSWNDCSNFMRIKYLGKTIMLQGDAEKEAETEFVNAYANKTTEFNVDVLKLGHHGSNTSSSTDYLNLILPSNRSNVKTIASCGLDNEYHHPGKDALSRLKSAGIKDENILLTNTKDFSNDINMIVDSMGLRFPKHDKQNSNQPTTDSNQSTNSGQEKNTEHVHSIRWWYIALGIWVLATIIIWLGFSTKPRNNKDKQKKDKPKDKN